MTTLAPTLNRTSVNNLINLILFQSVWFATILGIAQGTIMPGVIGLSLFVGVHLLTFESAKIDLALAALAILIGCIVETAVIQAGLIVYMHNLPFEGVAPAWILILWANLALTLNGCLGWLKGRYLLAAVLGATGAPLSYFGGIKLGAAATDSPLGIVLLTYALIYLVITPLLLHLANLIFRNTYKL